MPPDYSVLGPDYGRLRDQLVASERDTISLDIADTPPAEPWRSQLGGQPYLVDAADFPTVDGEPLGFLIQLNFAELPPLDGYPTAGLLQFFVGAADRMYGMSFWESPSQFHIRYHPVVEPGWTPRSPLPALEQFENTPLYRPADALAVTGALDRMPVPSCDRRFDTLLSGAPVDIAESVTDTPGGSRVGGYPFFCHEDDRDPAKDVLLLQLDSDGGSMEWGDGGTAQFFIAAADLTARHFAAAQYTWNCM